MKQPTKASIGRHLFMAPQRVGQLMADGALPDTGTLDDYRRAYITGLRKTAAGHQSADGALDLTAERAALARVQRERIEMENATTRGDLVRFEDVVTQWREEFSRARAKLLAMASKLAPLMVGVKTPAEAKGMIDTVVWEALNELSKPEAE